LAIAFSTVATVFSLNSARAMDDICATRYCTIYDLHSDTYEMPHVLLVVKGNGSPNAANILRRQCIANCPAPGLKQRDACISHCYTTGVPPAGDVKW
jgi:hypothetical protein